MVLCGGSIFARSWGASGETTVLCWHGAGRSHADYGRIAPELADRLGARVVAVDAPGHARSPAPTADAFRPSGLAGLAGLAIEILDELDVGQAAFVGFSWGATVGCWLGALHPERTLALALVEGGHFDFADLPGLRTDRTMDEFVAEAEVAAANEGADFGSHGPAVAGAMVYGLCREPATATYDRLAASGVPTLFVGAGGEGSSAGIERLSRLVPQTETVRLVSAGHDLLQDAPEEVARSVGDWLARLPAFA